MTGACWAWPLFLHRAVSLVPNFLKPANLLNVIRQSSDHRHLRRSA